MTPSLAKLLGTAIGRLALHQINIAERSVIKDEEIKRRVEILPSLINSASPSVRSSPDVQKALTKVISLTEFSPGLVSFLSRRHPAIMSIVAMDDYISYRIKYLYRICEIGECFSEEKLNVLNEAIKTVRGKMFTKEV